MPSTKPVSLSIAGLHEHGSQGQWSAGPRDAIDWAASIGFHAIQLDAAAPGLRARELGRSARRDLAASIRRNGMGFTGLDLWIPPRHFDDPATAERAADALIGAVGLASDLALLLGTGGAVVSVTLPAGLSEATREAFADHADRAGVLIEDFAFSKAPSENEPGAIRPGLDTARVVMRGERPEDALPSLAGSLPTLRLNDTDDTGRRPLGRGSVDLATVCAFHTTLAPCLPIVTDLRGLPDPPAAAMAALTISGEQSPGIGR